MSERINYIINSSGKKTSVIVPFEKWEKLNSDYLKIKNKLDVLLSIKEGMQEIKSSLKKGIELQNLTDFLNESIG